MPLLKYLLLIFILISLMACKTQKEPSSNFHITEVEFIEDGFSRAVIVHFPGNGEHCIFLIQKEDGSLLEPMDLEEQYQKADLHVWIKYNPQRRPSRCEGTTPVGITDIQIAR